MLHQINFKERTMTIRYHVPEMSCGHCVAAITKAVLDVAPGARVDADLAMHQVTVTGATQGDKIQAAIKGAGYTPTEVA